MHPKEEEAKRLLAGIVKHQKESDNKMQNLDLQVRDLKKAQQLIQEGSSRKSYVNTPNGTVSNDNNIIRKYMNDDGSVNVSNRKVKSLSQQHGILETTQEGLLDATSFENTWHESICKAAKERAAVRSMMLNPHTPKQDKRLLDLIIKAPNKEMSNYLERAFTDTAGEGAEWIPDQFSTDLFEQFEVPRGLRALLPTVNMDRETLLVPKLVRGGRPYLKGKVTDDLASYQASTIETAQKTIRATGFASLFNIDDSAAEDSAFAILPAMTRQISSDLEDAFEDCMLNGDTTAVHQDAIASWNIRSRWGANGLGTSADHRRGFLGFRAAALDKGAGKSYAGTAPTFATFMDGVAEMGEHGVSQKVLVVSPELMISTFLQMTQVVTVDQYGPAATILSGELAQLAGIPIIMSRFMGADLHTNGLYTGASTTSGFIVYSRDSWNQYLRRSIQVESQKDIKSGAVQVVATMRASMDSADATATKNVVYGYNCPIA